MGYYSNDNFNYRNKAVLDLPMNMAQHDPTNVQTLDVSGGGNNAEFGDGSTAGTFPTKLTKHGYTFDGGDYLTGTATGLFNSAEISIVMEFYPDFVPSVNVRYWLYTTSSASIYGFYKMDNANSNVLRCYLGNTVIVEIAEATYSPYWRQNGKNVIVITGDSANNVTNVWLNEGHVVDGDTTAWSVADPSTLHIGSRYDAINQFDGKVTKFQVYPFVLTPLQVQDILIDSNQSINNI